MSHLWQNFLKLFFLEKICKLWKYIKKQNPNRRVRPPRQRLVCEHMAVERERKIRRVRIWNDAVWRRTVEICSITTVRLLLCIFLKIQINLHEARGTTTTQTRIQFSSLFFKIAKMTGLYPTYICQFLRRSYIESSYLLPFLIYEINILKI